MLQTVCRIRVGAVFIDKNRELFLLCANCETEFDSLSDFRAHLEICNGLKHLFIKDTTFAFNSRNGKKTIGKKRLMYDVDDVRVIQAPPVIQETYKNDKDENHFDLTKIEEELLNPRWYTDSSVPDEPEINSTVNNKQTSKYTDLINYEIPFAPLRKNDKRCIKNKIPVQKPNIPQTEKGITHFKLCDNYTKIERIPMHYPKPKTELTTHKNKAAMEIKCNKKLVKSLTCSNQSIPHQSIKIQREQIGIPVKKVQMQKAVPAAELTSKLLPSTRNVEKTLKLVCKNAAIHNSLHPIAQHQTPRPPPLPPQQLQVSKIKPLETISTVLPTPSESIPTARTQQTEQILNKLQTLGLQIKRKNILLTTTECNPQSNTKRDETLKLLKKLQSKGMDVKILNKSTNSKGSAQPPQNSPVKKPKLDPNIMAVVNYTNANNNNALQANKPNFSKNIIIKKVK